MRQLEKYLKTLNLNWIIEFKKTSDKITKTKHLEYVIWITMFMFYRHGTYYVDQFLRYLATLLTGGVGSYDLPR